MIEKYREASKFGRQPSFSWASWITFIVAIGLVLLSVLQLVYRYSLPTDGWFVNFANPFDHIWIYQENLVGAPSQLQSLDELVAIEENNLLYQDKLVYLPKPPNWEVGKELNITVLRLGNKLNFSIPVVNWTPQAVEKSITQNTDIAAGLLCGFVITILSLYTFLKRPYIPAARVLLIMVSAFFANAISNILPSGISAIFNPISYLSAGFFSYIIFAGLLAPSLLNFTFVFPRPKQFIDRNTWMEVIPYICGLILSILILIGDSGLIGWIFAITMIILSIFSLIHSVITMRDAVSQAQIRWAIGGTIVGLLLAIFVFPAVSKLLHDPTTRFASLGTTIGFTVIGLALAVAILRYRLFDIDVIIRRTVQYGLITLLLAGIYFGCVMLLQNVLSSIIGKESQLVIVISTLAVAALFNPVRVRVQKLVDRRFFREKYNAAITMENFNSAIRDEVELKKIESQIETIITETFEPDIFSIWIKKK